MSAWPDLDEIKQLLDITSDEWDGTGASGEEETRLTRLLEAAIAKVKFDVGGWDEILDEPDARLAQAALRMAELLALKPELAAGTVNDPTYLRLMSGHRRRWGVG
jgi:hypothetical protein